MCRARSRCTPGSRRYRERTTGISRPHRRVNDVRTHHLHVLTTRLAKTHGRTVVDRLDAAGMVRQKGLSGARARRRGLSDAAPGTPGATCPIRRAGRGRSRSLPTAGSRRRKPAMPAGMCSTSDGPNAGTATPVRRRITVMTMHLSTSHATRTLLASLAQLGPPSSVEPTIRPGPAGLVAVKRGTEPATRPKNNPETGCESRDH